MVERLFLAVPHGCLRFVIVVFPDNTHLLFLGAQKNRLIETVLLSTTTYVLVEIRTLICWPDISTHLKLHSGDIFT